MPTAPIVFGVTDKDATGHRYQAATEGAVHGVYESGRLLGAVEQRARSDAESKRVVGLAIGNLKAEVRSTVFALESGRVSACIEDEHGKWSHLLGARVGECASDDRASLVDGDGGHACGSGSGRGGQHCVEFVSFLVGFQSHLGEFQSRIGMIRGRGSAWSHRTLRWTLVGSWRGGIVSEFWQLTAVEIAELVRKQEASAIEVTRSALDRLVAEMPEEAPAEAGRVDASIAAGDDPGVPVTIKVVADQAGHATTNGLRIQRDLVAEVDSPLVSNLRKAGAVIIGRTNTPAISVPAGFTSTGLPVGSQIVRKPQGDLELLRIAHAFEQETLHHQRRPALHALADPS
jgi:hypothetical protein